MFFCGEDSACIGHHGNESFFVVLGAVEGEGPKVRGCPKEDDEDEEEGMD